MGKVSLKSGSIKRSKVSGRTMYDSLTITGETGEITNESFVILDGTSNTVSATMTAPKEGQMLVVWCSNADNAVKITLAAGTWDGTNDVATFPASSCLAVFGVSSTRFVIIENVNTVTFS